MLDLDPYPQHAPSRPEYGALVDHCQDQLRSAGLFTLPGFMRRATIALALAHIRATTMHAIIHVRVHVGRRRLSGDLLIGVHSAAAAIGSFFRRFFVKPRFAGLVVSPRQRTSFASRKPWLVPPSGSSSCMPATSSVRGRTRHPSLLFGGSRRAGKGEARLLLSRFKLRPPVASSKQGQTAG